MQYTVVDTCLVDNGNGDCSVVSSIFMMLPSVELKLVFKELMTSTTNHEYGSSIDLFAGIIIFKVSVMGLYDKVNMTHCLWGFQFEVSHLISHWIH